MRHLVMFIVAAALAAPLVAQAPDATGEGSLCYNTYPIVDKQTGKILGCGCSFGLPNGTCSCLPNQAGGTACKVGDQCPDACAGGSIGDGDAKATAKKFAQIKDGVDAHKNIVTVFMKQCSYRKEGKFWLDEAARQGKALRIIALPDHMTPELLKEWRIKLPALNLAILEEEKAVDATRASFTGSYAPNAPAH